MENFYEEKLISCVDLDKRKKKKKKRQMRESIYLSTIKRDREREGRGGMLTLPKKQFVSL